ncbi:hypothetical protein CASFOL_006142 [Castilleja foliolosa]|uniref:Thioredoxin domain-containing protein n=1 Tax=Castilleja foliolosa TaxID=1961234 RepID=A0ABD3E6G4_9LAMI
MFGSSYLVCSYTPYYLEYDNEIESVLEKVESNLNKIEEHHRKYECLRKEKELRKIELQVQRQILQESESAYVLEDGQVIEIRSFIELKVKLRATEKASGLAVLYFTATWCGPCRYWPGNLGLCGKVPKGCVFESGH